MTGSASEKVDPAHWVGIAGSTVMMTVVALCTISLVAPWWTESGEQPGRKEETTVSLWMRYTRTELEADDTTLNCDEQCDYTKIGSAKVRESSLGWSDVCLTAADDKRLQKNCERIWVLRVFVFLTWFQALLYTAMSTFNFCGAGLPAAVRIPPATKLVLASGCVLWCLISILVAALMDVRVKQIDPGTEPRFVPSAEKLGLNGIGFLGVLASVILSVLGSGIAYLTQFVIAHLSFLADIESQGRPLADVNRAKPPDIQHQVGHIPYTPHDERPKKVLPAPRPIGAWMTRAEERDERTH